MRLLIKASSAATALRLGVAGSPLNLTLRPLMPNVDAARAAVLAAGAPAAWHVSAPFATTENPWDVCHRLMGEGLGVGPGGDIAFVEPDLEQRWSPVSDQGLGIGGGRENLPCTTLSQQSKDYPQGTGDGWYAGPEFSGLGPARETIGEVQPAVRIAHLDTGYYPKHRTKPARLREDLALNFADPGPNGEPAQGAFDQKTAEVNPMFGHGTATLALLAGEGYGGARGFEVVPLRVANWVVLFCNSAIAAALDHVLALARKPNTRCDVLSMSMGGLASAAWADAVNALYDAGVTLVTAAGNNYGNLPVRSVVYPARFNRVLAACGVMADGHPYADLAATLMAGCYGPDRKMRTALSAWTPNVPWARFGCPDAVDQDGGGTSAATPQIAAAAALWLQRHREALAGYTGWQRVEAVRDALFRAARRQGDAPDERLGRGTLCADAALAIPPKPFASLQSEKEDSTDFAILRLLTGLGAAPSPRQRMLELEALQISQSSQAVGEAMAGLDPADGRLAHRAWEPVLKAIADEPHCSHTLRSLIRDKLAASQVPGSTLPAASASKPAVPAAANGGSEADHPLIPTPTCRKLRVFTLDPSFASRMETRRVATSMIEVDWEKNLKPGPVGEYLEVVDIDPASQRAYAPVDLNLPQILAQNGLAPSEGTPQFHQQMVYAVAMRTIGYFRNALGRVPLWAERKVTPAGQKPQRRFVRRLRVYPHALREPNAYYSPDKRTLMFGYFRADMPGTIDVMKGGMIFTCLSHDVVAHETTHALLDGLHPYWKQPTNRDALAFHEAFADLVALFQHFTMPDALLSEIRRVRGQMRFADIIGGLAQQFGEAIGGHTALRRAIGKVPHPTDYSSAKDAHSLGEVLVAAVFDAWTQVYEDRTADLVRLATSGTGVLPAGAIPDDLARRLAEEAAKLARHFLNICIRALDYCPPVDPTFGEYLRAAITADADLVRDDPRGYRVALVEGFRRRGILPPGVQTWSPEAMVWEAPERCDALTPVAEALEGMTAKWHLNSDRLAAWKASRADAAKLHGVVTDKQQVLTNTERVDLLQALGLLTPRRAHVVGDTKGTASGIEVHSVRPLRRVGPDGEVVAAVIVELTQTWKPDDGRDGVPGGCTLIWDRTTRSIRYLVFKRVGHAARTNDQMTFRQNMAENGGTRSNYFRPDPHAREPFALMHSDH
ncbi:S8 family serine peptidase [Azospirillum sp.]|uniref:S8 family serine peptidase n=1 Tax=Azospirillum sp. TaxID=34012 RepID=UPI003D70F7EB